MRDKIYEFFVQYKEEHDGNRPSFETVGCHFGISRSAVKYHVDRDKRFDWYDGELCIEDGEWSLKSQESDIAARGTGTSL